MTRRVESSPSDESSSPETENASQKSTIITPSPGASPESPSSSSETVFKKPKAPRKRVRARGKAAPPPGYRDDVAETSLYYQIFCSPSDPMSTIVSSWIEGYKESKADTILLLLQFFLDASGCTGEITQEMLKNMKHEAIIDKLSNKLAQDGFYPLIKPASSKIFTTELSDFVQKLTDQCSNSIIYDGYLFDQAIGFLTSMTCSLVRAFRHTGTFIALKLQTALVHVHIKMKKQLAATTRQYDAERSKPREERAITRIETLLQKQQELNENIEEIEHSQNTLIENIYKSRFIDVLSEVRLICLDEVDKWMKADQETYVQPDYFKYVGWLLVDNIPDIRAKSLQILQHVFSTADQYPERLRLFLKKYKDRIFTMPLDVDNNVSAEAVHLAKYLHKYDENAITYENMNIIYQLIYASSRKLAQSVGEFFKSTLVADDEDTSSVPSLDDMVTFFLESNRPEHGPYLVDALIDTTPVLKDWKAMRDFLFFTGNDISSAAGEATINVRETAMIKLMVCAVKQTATGKYPPGRVAPKKPVSAKVQKEIQIEKREMTEYFIVNLPILLEKYNGDVEKLANLLVIPQFFELNVYTELRQENNLDLLLENIKRNSLNIFDEVVLEAAAKTLEVLCSDGSSIFTRCGTQRLALVEAIVAKFNGVLEEIKNSDESYLDKETLYKLEESLMKIAIFSSCHDMNGTKYWDSVIDIIFERVEGTTVQYPDEIIVYAIKACYFSLLWTRHSVAHDESLNLSNNDASITLHLQLNTFIGLLKIILTKEEFSDELQGVAFAAVVDLFKIFLNPNAECEVTISSTSKEFYDPAHFLADNVLGKFLDKYVFHSSADEGKDKVEEDALFGKRRNFFCGYCKLIIERLLPARLALPLFKNYVKYYNDFGDIMKMTLGSLRDHDRCEFAACVEESLNNLWSDIEDDFQAPQIAAILELAHRLSLLFGLDQNKTSKAIATLHRNGIKFALKLKENQEEIDLNEPPANVKYFQVLAVFTNKLTKPAKALILKYLSGYFPGDVLPSEDANDWEPFSTYREGLLPEAPTRARKTVRARRRSTRSSDRDSTNQD